LAEKRRQGKRLLRVAGVLCLQTVWTADILVSERIVNSETFGAMRRAMVSNQLRTNGVNDPRVIAAMGEVAREAFVPEERAMLAYLDRPVPLTDGRALNPPLVLGRLLTEAETRPQDRALVVGAGTGYAAAVLAKLVGSVVALEADGALAGKARAAGLPANVELVEGPLADGWAEAAPYELIYVDGSVECIPEALIAQLADGGRLVAPLVEQGVTRLIIGRRGGTGFGFVSVADAEAAPLPGFERPKEFSF
jgi:protein-L-isoaspartate(D-aspartate) O-methyltransferase